jgi:hypothetical protein
MIGGRRRSATGRSAKKEAAVTLSVTEECIEILRTYAAPIAPAARSRFYERVSELLCGVEVGPGAYYRACAAAQREFLVAPAADLEQPHPPSALPPRSPFRRRG